MRWILCFLSGRSTVLESCGVGSGGHFFAVQSSFETLVPKFVGRGSCEGNEHFTEVFDDALWSKQSFDEVRARGCVVSDEVNVAASHGSGIVLSNGGDFVTIDGVPHFSTRVDVRGRVSNIQLWVCNRVSKEGGRFLGVLLRRPTKRRTFVRMAIQIAYILYSTFFHA